MVMTVCWKNSDKHRSTRGGGTCRQFRFVHHKSRVDYSRIQPEPARCEAVFSVTAVRI